MHEKALRPSLGHPQQAQELSELCEDEELRHERLLYLINSHRQAITVIIQFLHYFHNLK